MTPAHIIAALLAAVVVLAVLTNQLEVALIACGVALVTVVLREHRP